MIYEDHINLSTESLPVHLFTDSKYSRQVLLDDAPRRKNFYLIEDIKNLASKLRFDLGMPISIHWIPSHIQHTIYGTRHIEGNRCADELAEQAREMSENTDNCNQTSHVRTQIQVSVTQLLRGIEQKLTPDDQAAVSSDGPSSQGDDFDYLDASQEHVNSCDT